MTNEQTLRDALQLGLNHARWSRDRSKDATERKINEQDCAKLEAALASLPAAAPAEGVKLGADVVDADKLLLIVHGHLQEALRIPTMPWPDPGAHGHEVTGRAIHSSYCALRFKVMDAIAALTAARCGITELLSASPEGSAGDAPAAVQPTADRIRAIANECGMFDEDYENAPGEYCDRFAQTILAVALRSGTPAPSGEGVDSTRQPELADQIVRLSCRVPDAVFTHDRNNGVAAYQRGFGDAIRAAAALVNASTSAAFSGVQQDQRG